MYIFIYKYFRSRFYRTVFRKVTGPVYLVGSVRSTCPRSTDETRTIKKIRFPTSVPFARNRRRIKHARDRNVLLVNWLARGVRENVSIEANPAVISTGDGTASRRALECFVSGFVNTNRRGCTTRRTDCWSFKYARRPQTAMDERGSVSEVTSAPRKDKSRHEGAVRDDVGRRWPR